MYNEGAVVITVPLGTENNQFIQNTQKSDNGFLKNNQIKITIKNWILCKKGLNLS